MYGRVIYLDGDAGRLLVDALEHVTEGLGTASIASAEAVVDYLAPFDLGEYPSDVEGPGFAERMAQVDNYLLEWGSHQGYVTLWAILDEDGEPVDVTTCRGCGSPTDYCLDHTHAPSEEDETYSADYDAVSQQIGAFDRQGLLPED